MSRRNNKDELEEFLRAPDDNGKTKKTVAPQETNWYESGLLVGFLIVLGVGLVVVIILGLVHVFGDHHDAPETRCTEYVVVANRNDTSMSWINVDDESIFTPEFIGFDSNYVWAPRDRDEVAITDFFGGGYGVFNLRTKRMTDFYHYAPCNGSMHLFGNVEIDQMWIPCRLTGTIHAAWYTSGTEIAVMNEFSLTHEPHDVSVTNTAAYISFNSSTTSYISRYTTNTFVKTGDIVLPFPNAHTLWDEHNGNLYGTANGATSGSVYLFDMSVPVPAILAQIPFPTAPVHGFVFNRKYLYVADFNSSPAHIFKISIRTFAVVNQWTLPINNIHNIELSEDNRKLFATQTAGDSVTVFDLNKKGDIILQSYRVIIPYIENPAGLYRTQRFCEVVAK